MKKFIATVVVTMCVAIAFSGCSDTGANLNDIGKPGNIATSDEVHPTMSGNSVEECDNVNGMHYTATLNEFTSKYNLIMMNAGGTEYLYTANWKTKDGAKTDSNGVEYQCFYYDGDNFNFTASVETGSEKIINLGCGTTMNNFVDSADGVNNSDIILRACAVMAAAVCGFDENSLDVLQDIFYRTTFENVSSLWYEGNIFSLSTDEDSSNSDNNIMLFRIFPVTDELKDEWQIPEYEKYISENSTV